MESKQDGKVINISIVWFFLAFVIIFSIIAFFKNYILATNSNTEIEVKAFEKNNNSINILKVIVESNDKNKKLINEEREIAFETVYEENPNLPKDEEQIKQEGVNGKIKVTALQEFKNEKMINEDVIESTVVQGAITNIIYRGTSEFLRDYEIHIGDTMYLMEIADLKEQDSLESNTILTIKRYLKVTVEEVRGEWTKVKYLENEGYIENSKLTSESVTPMITEKNRIATLKENLKFEMELNKPSGLTLSDYKTIFSELPSDKNNIFSQNVETFYNIEQKYKINGIFVAAIGIHESGWGTSKLAMDKHNLFGFAAYDRDPYNSAANFETYDECIDTVAKALAKNYLHLAGTNITEDIVATAAYNNGPTLSGVNTRYASDENWANKVFNYMEYLYGKL